MGGVGIDRVGVVMVVVVAVAVGVVVRVVMVMVMAVVMAVVMMMVVSMIMRQPVGVLVIVQVGGTQPAQAGAEGITQSAIGHVGAGGRGALPFDVVVV